MFKNPFVRTKRISESKGGSVGSSPCKRTNYNFTIPWGVLFIRNIPSSEVKAINLINDVEEIRYNQLLNSGFNEVVFAFSYNLDYNLDYNLICYFDGVYLNQSPLDKGKQYNFKNEDELVIKLKDNQQLKIDIQIKMEQTNKVIKDVKDNLNCTICKYSYSFPITLIPCFHTFCGKCIIQEFKSDILTCPVCNQSVCKVYKNDTLLQIVHKLVLNSDGSEPSPLESNHKYIDIRKVKKMISKYFDSNEMQEISQCVYEISFKRNRPVIKSIEPVVNYNGEYKQVILNSNGKGNDKSFNINVDLESYNKYNKYKDQDIVPIHSYKCTYCLPVDSQPSRYLCSKYEHHIICDICTFFYPRKLKKNKSNCALCYTNSCPSCDLILYELGIKLESKRWIAYQPKSFPSIWFNSNTIDSQIFQNYLDYCNLSPTTFYRRIITKIQNKEILLQDFKYQSLTWDTKVCDFCVNNELFNELAFHFRAQMTNEELQLFQEDINMKRKDCYFGRKCVKKLRTKGRENYNHACHPWDKYYEDNSTEKNIFDLR
ncbi:hypothetical protein K502DRAFT_363375 [Neoconidiobolus thromboides FSU 785]|nr:hypothetical protein K502DRAFT_363375 [Neoconidiobolus thromboides FSU 785]